MHGASFFAIREEEVVRKLDVTGCWGYLRQYSLVFVISKLTPLIESVELKLTSVSTSSFLQKIVLRPFILHALVA